MPINDHLQRLAIFGASYFCHMTFMGSGYDGQIAIKSALLYC